MLTQSADWCPRVLPVLRPISQVLCPGGTFTWSLPGRRIPRALSTYASRATLCNSPLGVCARTEFVMGYLACLAIDVDTKLVPSIMVGNCDGQTARIFIGDCARSLHIASRLRRYLKVYVDAVEASFCSQIDYTKLVKRDFSAQPETRSS
jgi:hypothetical protein